MVGIAGGSAAGKTTLSRAVAAGFDWPVLIICLDEYYDAERLLESSPRANINWDHPEAINFSGLVEDLRRLKSGLSIPTRTYDYRSHKVVFTGGQSEPTDVILIEGALLLANPEARELCDYRVFIYTEPSIRLARRIARDTRERGLSISDVLDWCERFVEPMHDKFIAPSMKHADMIISGEEPVDQLAAKILEQLASLKQHR